MARVLFNIPWGPMQKTPLFCPSDAIKEKKRYVIATTDRGSRRARGIGSETVRETEALTCLKVGFLTHNMRKDN